MSNWLNKISWLIQLKQGLSAYINATATVNQAVLGEPAYTTDTRVLYIFDGSHFVPVCGVSPYATTSVDLLLTESHHWVKATAACTITLPPCSGIVSREYIITATDNGVIVDGNSAETINGSLTKTLNAYESIQIKTDGSNWLIIG